MTEEAPVARLYLDHDVDARLAGALRLRGFDIVTTIEVGMQEASDLSQLTHAVEDNRIFVTHNIRHFPTIHVAWLGEGQHHHGLIVLAGYPPIGIWLQRMQSLFAVFQARDLRDQLLFLGAELD